MVPGWKRLLRQLDASSALKRERGESVTSGPRASVVLASTAVIIPHFHAETVFLLFVCLGVVVCFFFCFLC